MSISGNMFSSVDSDESSQSYTEKSYSDDSSKTLLTIKGDSAKIEGKLIISKSIEIDCEVQGELVVDGQLIIQQSGYVNADVKTINATVNGIYEGNMEASGNVQINQTGKVNGNIKTDSLIIEKGGVFSGNVVRITENTEEKKNKPEPVEKKDSKPEPAAEKISEYNYEPAAADIIQDSPEIEIKVESENKDEDILEL